MTSTVTNYSSNINANYPTPGVDNDTQGFRDNFSSIQRALTIAASEITSLQQDITKTSEPNTDFNYNSLSRVGLKAYGEVTPELKSITNDGTIDFLEGNYQKLSIQNSAELSVINWPKKTVNGRLRLEVYNASSSTKTLNFAAGNIKKANYLSLPQTLSTSSLDRPVIFDLWSNDNGETVFIDQVLDMSTSLPTTVPTAGVVTTPSQPYITSVGTLTNLSISSATIRVLNNQMIISGVGGLTIDTGIKKTKTLVGWNAISPGYYDSLELSDIDGLEVGSTFKFYSTSSNIYAIERIFPDQNIVVLNATYDAANLTTYHGLVEGVSQLTFNISLAANGVFYAPRAPETLVGKEGDKPGKVFANSATVYVCHTEYTDGVENIWTPINTVAVQSQLMPMTATTGTVDYDIGASSTFLHQDIIGTITPNFINLPTEAIQKEVFITLQQGSTGYGLNSSTVQIAEIDKPVKWLGGSAPGSWSANSFTKYKYTLINNGSGDWFVLGEKSDYV
jgi:hypothetical protein